MAFHVLQTLSLDCNEVASLQGWGRMPSLRSLSLRGNALHSADQLAPLACCPSLRSLDLRANPVAESQAGLREAVLAVLPALTTLNGEQI